MKKKLKLKQRRKIDKISLYVVVIILVFMSIILGLGYLNKKISPILLNYAELETRKLSNIIINRALTKQLASGIDIENLFNIIQNKDGEIQTVDFNAAIVNKVLNTTTSIIQINLKAIQEGRVDFAELPEDINADFDKEKLKRGIVYEIPIGVVTGNAFLSNLGPKIPVKLNIIGDVMSNIRTQIQAYGINNALIEVFVHIEITEQVNIPLMSKRVTVSSDIPIAVKLIQGKVPTYFSNNGITKDSNIFSIPME